MRIRNWTAIAALACIVGACSREDAAPEPTTEQAGNLPADHVFGDQVKAMEKAQGVQQTLDAATARTRESVERQARP